MDKSRFSFDDITQPEAALVVGQNQVLTLKRAYPAFRNYCYHLTTPISQPASLFYLCIYLLKEDFSVFDQQEVQETRMSQNPMNSL